LGAGARKYFATWINPFHYRVIVALDLTKRYLIQHKNSGRYLTAHRHYPAPSSLPSIKIGDDGLEIDVSPGDTQHDERNSGSTFVCVHTPGWDGRLWQFAPQGHGHTIRFADTRDGQQGWLLSAHRHNRYDVIDENTTAVMIHKPGWDGRTWSLHHIKGDHYTIRFAEPRDGQNNWGLSVSALERNSGSDWVCIARDDADVWNISPA
jgi:hypothetical protein